MKNILKWIGVTLLAIIVLVALVGIYNNSPSVILSKLLKKGSVKTSELQYRVNFLGVFPVAQAIFFDKKEESLKGQKVYHLSGVAETLKRYKQMFSASAVLDSYIDIVTGNPMLFTQKVVSPGKESPSKEVIYDQVNKTITIKGEKRDIFPDTQDALSAIFKIRHMDLEKTKEFEMSINTSKKNYVLRAKVEPREIIIKKNKFKTFIVKGDIRRRDKNNPYHQTKITMVLLKDKENVPIYIKVFASGALITARLVDTK